MVVLRPRWKRTTYWYRYWLKMRGQNPFHEAFYLEMGGTKYPPFAVVGVTFDNFRTSQQRQQVEILVNAADWTAIKALPGYDSHWDLRKWFLPGV